MADAPELPLLPLDVLPRLAADPDWSELDALRALAGPGVRPVGYSRGPDARRPVYAFLAADLPGTGFRVARRSVALLKVAGSWALAAFDFATPAVPGTRQVVRAAAGIACATLLPRDAPPGASEAVWRKSAEDATFLRAAWPAAGPAATPALIWSLDLAGVRIGDRAVLFHTGAAMARSSVYFDLEGPAKLQYLVTGLAPGTWEIWWNGWLEDPQGGVEPEAGTLYFEGPPGSYYLRRLS